MVFHKYVDSSTKKRQQRAQSHRLKTALRFQTSSVCAFGIHCDLEAGVIQMIPVGSEPG